ncbi:MAG: hypothetical protein WCL32_09435 [Planctomycetota bacterium]
MSTAFTPFRAVRFLVRLGRRTLFRKTGANRLHDRVTRLLVEELHQKIVPAAVDFTNATNDSLWSNAANWNPALTPNSGTEEVTIDAIPAIVFAPFSVYSVEVSNGGSVLIGGAPGAAGSIVATDTITFDGAGTSLSVGFGGFIKSTTSAVLIVNQATASLGAAEMRGTVGIGLGSTLDMSSSSSIVNGNLGVSGQLTLSVAGTTPSVSADYFQDGHLVLNMSGSAISKLSVGGQATLGGTVGVDFAQNPNDPIQRNGSYDFVVWGTRAGTFATTDVNIGGIDFTIEYDNNEGVARFIGPGMGNAQGNNRNVGLGQNLNGSIGSFVDLDAPGLTGSDFTISIDWGDGATGLGVLTGSAGSYIVTPLSGHTYSSAGTYSASFTVEDNASGLSTDAYFDVLVQAPVTVAQFTFEATTPVAAGPYAAEIGSGQISQSHASGSTVYSNPVGNGSAESFSANRWQAGDAFIISISTLGLKDLSIKWDQAGSATGPRDFGIEYAIGSGSFSSISTYTVPLNNWNSTTHRSGYSNTFDLGAIDLIEDESIIFIRLICIGTSSIGGGAIGNSGTSRIDDLIISGFVI